MEASEIIFINLYPILSFVFLLTGLVFSGLKYFNQISDTRFFKLIKNLFFVCLSFVFLRIVFLFLAQYLIWFRAEPFLYFLPPHQSIVYFLDYAWLHFAKLPVFNLGLSLFLFLLVKIGTRVSRGRFFYEEEQYSGGLAILLNSWPENILVFVLVLSIGLFVFVLRSFYFFLKRKKGLDQQIFLNFRYFWIIIGLFIFLFGESLAGLFNLGILRI
jgi:hypothetical protein